MSFYTQQGCGIFRDSSKNGFTVWRLGSVKGVFVIFRKILLYGDGVGVLNFACDEGALAATFST